MRGLFVPCVVFGAALAAGLALVSPIALVWAEGTSVLQAELLVQNMPEASAAGAMTAVMVAVVIGALGIPVLGWLAAVCGLAGVLADHAIAAALTPTPTLTTMDYADGLWGGMVLGGLAVVPARPGVRVALVLGAVASIVGGTLTESPLSYRAPRPAAAQAWPFLDSPPLWLVGPVLALTLVCTWRSRRTPLPPGRRVLFGAPTEVPLRPVISALLVVVATLWSSSWLADGRVDAAAVVLAVVVVVLAAVAAGWLLPRPDGELVTSAVALTTVASSVIFVPMPWWSIWGLILAVIAGFTLGRHRTATLLAPLSVAVIAIAVASAEALGHGGDGVRITAAFALALTAGYLFAVAASTDGRNLVVATALLFVPSVVIAMRGRDFGRAVYSPHWLRVSGGVHACAPCLAAAAIAAGCAAGVYLQRKRHPDPRIGSTAAALTTVRSDSD